MHADKTRYITVYGIAPFVKDFIIHNAKGKCFIYNFDETTTSKVEKQYDGISLTLVIFLSKSLQHIVDLCLSDIVLAKT